MTDNKYCGVLNIKKEAGYTSFHVVSAMRSITGVKKIGHTGTLDPDVSGVLPVCIGKATKLISVLEDTDKTYKAVMMLGKLTDTQDISGTVLEECSNEYLVSLGLTIDTIYECFKKFTGTVSQLPPMYSALKVNGVKLVDAARKGIEIERKPRNITIYGYEDISFNSETFEISFTVTCSKGTYIRTLCQDIGKALGAPACMKNLIRTRAAGLDIDDSITLDEARSLSEQGILDDRIISVDSFLTGSEKLVLNDASIRFVKVGNSLYPENFITEITEDMLQSKGSTEPASFRIYDEQDNFYALYEYAASDKCFKCKKMFI